MLSLLLSTESFFCECHPTCPHYSQVDPMYPLAVFPGRSLVSPSASQGHGNWAPGDTQRTVKLHLYLKETVFWLWENTLSPSSCLEEHPAMPEISLSPLTCSPSQCPGFALLTCLALISALPPIRCVSERSSSSTLAKPFQQDIVWGDVKEDHL